MPPPAAISTLSASCSRISRHLPAPNARRTANSWWRVVPRASTRFARFGARHDEHHQDETGHHDAQAAHRTRLIGVQVGEGSCRPLALAGRDLSGGSFDGGFRTEPTEDGELRIGVRAAGRGEGNPDASRASERREREPRVRVRHDADDLERPSADADRAPDGIGVGGEVPAPELVAYDRDRRARLLVCLLNGSAERGLDADRREVVWRDGLDQNQFGLTPRDADCSEG